MDIQLSNAPSKEEIGAQALGPVQKRKNLFENELSVKTIERLRVYDANALALRIRAHYQAAVYAMAKQGAEWLASASWCLLGLDENIVKQLRYDSRTRSGDDCQEFRSYEAWTNHEILAS